MANNPSYNEVFIEPGRPRDLYEPLVEAVRDIGSGEFSERASAARDRLRELGATFPLPGSSDERERVLPADWTPRIIPHEHWQRISAGILQRGRAINAWLTDLYNGDQEVVPREIVESSVFYRDRSAARKLRRGARPYLRPGPGASWRRRVRGARRQRAGPERRLLLGSPPQSR